MNILELIFGKKKPAKKKAVVQSSKSAQAKQATGTKQTTPSSVPRTGPAPARSKPGLSTIENMNGVPGYFSVISSTGGELALTPTEMQDYLILRLTDGKEDLAIVRSTDKYKAGVDHSYMTIKERIKSKGLNITIEYLASREIIQLVYDRQAEGRLEVKNKSAIIGKVDLLLKDALNAGVSDVHIEVRRDQAEVRFRKHGDLYLRHDWPVQYAKDVSVVIYQVMAEEKDVMFNPTCCQDAVLDRILDGKRLRVRIGTVPAAPDGYDMVMRLLPYDESEVQVKISGLGYLDEQLLDIEMGLSKPTGVIVLAGVTGSGKTTSLAAMIREIVTDANGTIKVITVENPPEQFMKGVTQSPAGAKTGSKDSSRNEDTPFSEAMKGALRADPDIIMVGEVRDTPTAKLLISAVQSGHKVLTTLHAPSGIGIVSRMRSLGVPNDVLGGGDFFSALIYQTLIKTLCQNCSFTLDQYQDQHNGEIKFEKLLKRLIMTVDDLDQANIRFVNTNGCDCSNCFNGVTGRTVVAEVIIPDHQMISLFAVGKDMEAWKHFRSSGGKSALMVGVEKMKSGLLDPYDVEKALGLMNAEIIMGDGIFNYNEERIFSGASSNNSVDELSRLNTSLKDDAVNIDSFIVMDEPNIDLASSNDFDSELLSENIRTAEVIQIGSKKIVETDESYDPAD